MSKWILPNGCTIDEKSVNQEVICNGEAIHLRRKCWSLLIELLKAKRHRSILSYEGIGDILWYDDGGWDESRKGTLNKILREIRNAIGAENICNSSKIGYYLSCEVEEVYSPCSDWREYYEQLWMGHTKGTVRDQVATGNVRELIDFFVLPTITARNNEVVATPFADSKFSKLLMAGSGFGKSALLSIILLCNLANELMASNSKALSTNSISKKGDYQKIFENLFGSSSKSFFPVFINSDKANTCPFESPLQLADASEMANFIEMVDEAYNAGMLLFLIDSIDEVDSDKLNHYLSSINKMLEKYKNANVVFASRFLGKRELPFQFDLLYIKELEMHEIKKITSCMLSEPEADKFICRLNQNRYLYSISKNPFMLMTILETKGERLLHHLLKSIVNAIIDRRWQKRQFDISSENIKLLLGFLACKFVFENKEKADISEVRQCFMKVGENLKMQNISYDESIQNIESFINALSSQSGILNIINEYHVEKCLFQDDLIMCWLAANYINELINESENIHEREGLGGIWSNVYWVDRFIRSVSSKELYLSSLAVNVLVLTLVMSSENKGKDIQKSILYFLICRDATSLNEEEHLNITLGYRDILGNVFGENDITNNKNSESLILINKMMNLNT